MLLRIKYQKTQEGRFLSHLDTVRTLERICRRARLPLAFSEGFNPHPKVSYGSALAVGVTSDGEYLDIELLAPLEQGEVFQRLKEAMPPAFKVLEIRKLTGRVRSLTADINVARYCVELAIEGDMDAEVLQQKIALVFDQETFEVIRQGKNGPKPVEIRKGLYALSAEVKRKGRLIVHMDVQTGSQGNIRPEEVVQMLALLAGFQVIGQLIIHRVGLFVRSDKGLQTPFDVA